MPFTFAHPAIMIPLIHKRAKWFDGTALILGSMAPDFEYFIRFKAQAVAGHTLSGFLFFNLPLIFLAALLWHVVIKKPFFLSLPNFIHRYCTPFLTNQWRIRSIRAFVIFVMSAVIGMASHVIWDAFTHVDGYFVNSIPLLKQYIVIFGTEIAVYKILQHGSTLVGFGIIFVYLYLKSQNTKKVLPKVHRGKQLGYWISSLLVAFGVVIFRVCYTLQGISIAYYGIYIVSFISGTIIGIVSVSLIFQTIKIYDCRFD